VHLRNIGSDLNGGTQETCYLRYNEINPNTNNLHRSVELIGLDCINQ
jgi:hypothetical protein